MTPSGRTSSTSRQLAWCAGMHKILVGHQFRETRKLVGYASQEFIEAGALAFPPAFFQDRDVDLADLIQQVDGQPPVGPQQRLRLVA